MLRLIVVVILAAFLGWLTDATKAEVLLMVLMLDIGLPKGSKPEVDNGDDT